MKVAREWTTLKTLVVLLALSVTVIIAYYPGLHGPFVFDDQVHILADQSIRLTSATPAALARTVLADDGSAAARPLAKLSLAINFFLSGGTSSSTGYKITNLAIHLVNAGLVYCLALILIRRTATNWLDSNRLTPEWISILVAALWALHPLHLTSVLYVVQRMTSMAALFVLAGLIAFTLGRQRVQEQHRHGFTLMVAGAICGLLLGLGGKENAVAILPLMLVVEYVFFSYAAETTSNRKKLRLFYTAFVFSPVALLTAWLITHPSLILDAYAIRDFGPVERLLTESRVLWYYVSLLIVPRLGELSLYHDDIEISRGLLEPWTTSVALFSIATAIGIAFLARRRHPLLAFAILWFLIGHGIESSFIGLEIAHEHRNYLPDIGPLLALGYGLAKTAQRFRLLVRVALLLAPLATLLFVTMTLAHTWASEERIIESLARHHPASPRGQYMLAELYAKRKHDLLSALTHYRRAAALAPNETGYLIKVSLTTAVMKSGIDESGETKSKDLYASSAGNNRETGSQAHSKPGLTTDITPSTANTTLVEIANRLEQQPITPITQHVLGELAPCVEQITDSCRMSYPYIKAWYLAAAKNLHLNRKQRAELVIHLFDLGANRPDLDLSMEAVELGRGIEPQDPVYLLMEANVLILRGELDTADALLQSLARYPETALTGEIRDNARVLLAQIAARRAVSLPGQTPLK